MRKLAKAVTVIAVVLVGLAYALRNYKVESERDNAGDIGDAPNFYVSNQALLTPGKPAIRVVPDADAGEPRGAPYFIAFDDGSYVWGRASIYDATTRDVYSDRPYQLYWNDDAVDEWMRRHAEGAP